MIALGIDPGTRLLGWGVVRRHGSRIEHIHHGVLRLDGSAPIHARLRTIHDAIAELIEQHEPDVGSVEAGYWHRDARAAEKLGQARGVVLLAFALGGLEIAEYPPARVKLTVAGSGRADKRQVAEMIRARLALAKPPPADAADALAIACTHLQLARSASTRAQLPPEVVAALSRRKPRSRRATRKRSVAT